MKILGLMETSYYGYVTFKEKSISQRMSLIKGILSEVGTNDLIDQHNVSH